MVSKGHLIIILLFSVILHETIHLIQIFFIDNMTYEGWGIGIHPFFYWIVDYPSNTGIYELQAYGIQTLFLIGVLLNQRVRIDWRHKCVSC